MRVLITDDDLAILQTIGEYLELRGMNVDYASSGRAAIEHTQRNEYDVIVLDVRMPRMTGLQACKKMRDAGIMTPILFLTARDSLDDKLSGFSAGADDYLVKPFAYEELEARLVALSKRVSTEQASRFSVGDLEVNLMTNEVTRAGVRLQLNPIQFRLLKCLALKSPGIVTRQELENRVWGDDLPDSDALRTHMFRLRSIVDKPFSTSLLQTVHGVGFRLSPSEIAEMPREASE